MLENYFIDEYLDGRSLVGDNFNSKEIEKWYKEEEEAYADLINHEYSEIYEYENINNFYGLRLLVQELVQKRKITIVCFGAAYGGEVFALHKLLDEYGVMDYKVIVIDSSDSMLKYIDANHHDIELQKARIDGRIDMLNEVADLITCFGVLHHIPNVSYILGEFSRILKKDGAVFIREPITSMGDWRKTRAGCTKNERGLPIKYFQKICRKNSLKIISQKPAFFPPLIEVSKKIKVGFKSKTLIVLDRFFSYLFSWNAYYYRPKFYMKFGPGSCYWILKK